MATWKTGRTRTLHINGSFTIDDAASYGQGLPVSYGTEYQFTATIGGTVFKAWKNSGTNPATPGPVINLVEVDDSQLGSDSHIWPPLYVPPPPLFHLFTLTGSWSISVDVEEYASTYVPSNSAAVNGTNFPNYGGSAQGDGLPATGIHYYELTKIGGSKTVSITYAGQTAVLTTASMASAVAVGYVPYYNGWFTQQLAGGWHPGITYAFGASFHWSDSAGFGIPGTNFTSIPASLDLRGGGVGSTAISDSTVDTSYIKWDTTYFPGGTYTFNGRLRTFGQAFPSSHLCSVNDWFLHTTNVTLNPNGSYGPWTQTDWSYVVDLDGTGYSGSQKQIAPVFAYLFSLSPDDSNDWRCPMVGFTWDAISLSRAGTLSIDPCTALTHWTAGANTTASITGGHLQLVVSGGTGSATLAVPSSVRVWEIYRYLQIGGYFTAPAYDNTHTYSIGDLVLQAGTTYRCILPSTGHTPPNATYWEVFTGTIDFNVTLAGKVWHLPLGTSGQSPLLDLSCAFNDATTVQTKQTRFPIANPGGFPINTDPTIQYSMGQAAVAYCDSLVVGNILDGYTLTLTDVSLASSANAQKQSAVTLLETFLNFLTGWTSPTDNTTIQDFLYIESDYRVMDLPALALVTPIGPGSPTYTWYSIAQMQTMLAYFPGLTATLLTCPVSDGYHGSGQYALNLGANGASLAWGGTPKWTDWVDVSLPQNLPAQDCWDEVISYYGAGNVWTQSAPYGGVTPVYISKDLRCQAWGMVFNDNTPVAMSGVQVKLFETATPTTTEGVGLTGLLGQYKTGANWGYGNVDSETQCILPPIPYLNATGTIQNRERRRTSFRRVPLKLKKLDYDVSQSFRHGRVSSPPASTTLWTGYAPNGNPYDWVDLDSGITSGNAACRWQDHGNQPFGLLYDGGGGTLLFAQTPDEGQTFTMATTISSTLATNGFFDFEEAADFTRWYYWLEGSAAPYTVYMCVLDPQLNVTKARTATNITDADLAEIRVKEYPISGNGKGFGFQYARSGTLIFKTSTDGVNFT